MKKYLIVLCLCIAYLSNSLSASNVTAYFTYSTFKTPSKGSYVETYLSVVGYSLKFVKNANGKYQGAVDITVGFKQNGEIKNAQKYTLNSPETDDTTKGFPNFIDQQRYFLPDGAYDVELSISDKNKAGEKPFVTNVPISLSFRTDSVCVSSIQLLESYTKSIAPSPLMKSGYDLVPYVANFYPENISKIKFYSEVYNSKKIIGEGQKILLSYYLESADTRIRLNNFSLFSKQVANDVNIGLNEFDIESLPTGNYNLVLEVRDKDNKLQAKQQCFIQRKNKQVAMNFDDMKTLNVALTFVRFYRSIDTLGFYIKSLRPISTTSEIQYAQNQLKGKDLVLMQQYFYNFWKSRYPLNPEQAWQDYYVEVQKVNKEFGTYGLRGFDTDRGRVYLQYGPPDQRSKYDTEPSAIPYEIWEYYSLNDKTLILTDPDNKQSTKKFIFYNPDLVTNKYVLIHSDARGEIYNERWNLLINSRNTQSSNIDDTSTPDGFGSHSLDNFNNPR
ncbi:MAG: GWxTD domain-containing protein [Bacteroidia bacterium]